MDWFRWHNRTVTDAKWRAVARRTGLPVASVVGVWAAMCENANQSPTRGTLAGWSDEDAAAALDLETEQVAAAREAMQGKVLDGDALTGWEKRNPRREDATAAERKRRQRDMSRTVTHGHAPEIEEEGEVEGELETASSVLKLHAGEPLDVERQMNEIIRAANRGMGENPAIGSAYNPISIGHGSREAVRVWLDLAPFEVVQEAVFEKAKMYQPDPSRRQITTMAYFNGPVRQAADRWKASKTEVKRGNRSDDSRAPAAARGTPRAGKFDHLIVDGSAA